MGMERQYFCQGIKGESRPDIALEALYLRIRAIIVSSFCRRIRIHKLVLGKISPEVVARLAAQARVS